MPAIPMPSFSFSEPLIGPLLTKSTDELLSTYHKLQRLVTKAHDGSPLVPGTTRGNVRFDLTRCPTIDPDGILLLNIAGNN